MTKDEALKLALEALEEISSYYMSLPKKGCMALAAIEEALAEQETVLPGGGHVPAVPVAVYGYCPECGGVGVMRERRPNGDDKCTNGHKYPSSKALAEQPAQPEQCECPACKVTPHASDCAVHNEPAYPKGACDCGAQPYPDNFIDALMYDVAKRDSEAQQAYEDAFVNGTGVMIGDKRIDPASIYKEPEQEPVAWKDKTYGNLHHQDFGNSIPLYTSPQPSKPLTNEQIMEMYNEPRSDAEMIAFARAIEAAHGIGEQK